MKKIMIFLGLVGSTTVAFGQAAQSPKITQEGEKNTVNVKMQGGESDTLATHTRIITQKGTNQVHIEAATTPDSLNRMLENVAINQEGKGNKVSITSGGGQGNTVQINQSGSKNSIIIKQN